MTLKELNSHMKLLKLMLADLNDAHNNYDVDTMTENRYKEDLDDAISDFNSCQDVWSVSLINTGKRWCLKYE